jgi:ketosteroid isomerase-like protein
MQDERDDVARRVEAIVYAVFEAGKNKDFASLERLHLNSEEFSKFDEFPPFTRQDSKQALIYEEAAFANITDFQYELQEMKVDIFGQVAIATFYLDYRGVFVNDYSFEGSPVRSRSRATIVLLQLQDGWKIVHEHFSSFPDWPAKMKSQTGGV